MPTIEKLPKQVVSDDYVQIRHFTIIDEAHYARL